MNISPWAMIQRGVGASTQSWSRAGSVADAAKVAGKRPNCRGGLTLEAAWRPKRPGTQPAGRAVEAGTGRPKRWRPTVSRRSRQPGGRPPEPDDNAGAHAEEVRLLVRNAADHPVVQPEPPRTPEPTHRSSGGTAARDPWDESLAPQQEAEAPQIAASWSPQSRAGASGLCSP